MLSQNGGRQRSSRLRKSNAALSTSPGSGTESACPENIGHKNYGGKRQEQRRGTYERSNGAAGCDPLKLCAKLRLPPICLDTF